MKLLKFSNFKFSCKLYNLFYFVVCLRKSKYKKLITFLEKIDKRGFNSIFVKLFRIKQIEIINKRRWTAKRLVTSFFNYYEFA